MTAPALTAARTCDSVPDRVLIPAGHTGHCSDCGRVIAGRNTALRLGVAEHVGHGLCGACAAAGHWGVYAAAIARHEQVLGRPAPDPTQPSAKTGNPQLSAGFVEWMQMLPAGWVTAVPGLVDSPRKSERNAQLSMLGDGVCPSQGTFAFRFLLDHLAERLASERAA
jgi:DNA (cytosine-5)-methyltransferase 1